MEKADRSPLIDLAVLAQLVERFHGKEKVSGSSPEDGSKMNHSRERNSKKEKRRKNQALTTHHIIPRSRGGSDEPDNLILIMESYHDKYHDLFQNMTPQEILIFLETYFWGNQKSFIDDYSFNRDKLLK